MNLDSSSDSRVTLRARFRTETRAAILDAAADVLNGDAAAHARMEDIAARAGVAVGTVYNYFADRTALVSALLQTRTETLMTALDAPPAAGRATRRATATAGSAAESFATELTHFVATVGAHVDANRFLLGVLRAEEQERGIDAAAASRRLSVLGDLMMRAERLMKKGIRARALRREDPTLYAALLIGMIRGAALTALNRQAGSSAEGTAALVRVFMTGAAR